MRKVYTQEHIDYVREIARGRYNDEITKMFNEKFNMNQTESAIISLKARYKIRSYVSNGKVDYTQEHLEYLREITPGRFNKEITEMFNKKFNESRSERAIKNIRQSNNIKTDVRWEWDKGHVPWNKGKKGYMGANKTSFKKGTIPPNQVPVGTVRVTVDGYTEVKVKDPNKWKGKQIIEWEKVNGPLPSGNVVLFGDGDRTNFDINNLISVSRKQLLGLNRYDLIQDDAELTKTAINVVDLKYKIAERNGNSEGK